MTAPGLVQIGRAAVRNGAQARHADDAADVVDQDAAWQHNASRFAQLRPRQAQVYLENRCHLRCAHCYETSTTHPHDDALTLAEYEHLFDQLAQLGVLFLTFTGGEIFLRRDVLDIVAAARARRFAVTLLTSGTLIDDDKADRLRALHVHDVHVSVYSADPDVHDAFTGVPRSHERSVRALRLLHARGVRTVLKANVMTFNVEHLDALLALARDVGADFQLDPTVKPRMDGDRSPLRFAVPPDELRRRIYHRPDLYEAFVKAAPEDYCDGTVGLVDASGIMCGAARQFVSIAANGDVHACGFFPSSAGSIRKRPLAEIWSGSPDLARVRDTTMASMNACPTCDVRSTCGPCMAYAEVEHGDARGCASSSRQAALAVSALASERARKNAQMSRGRSLPIVGSLDVERPPIKGGSRRIAPLSSE